MNIYSTLCYYGLLHNCLDQFLTTCHQLPVTSEHVAGESLPPRMVPNFQPILLVTVPNIETLPPSLLVLEPDKESVSEAVWLLLFLTYRTTSSSNTARLSSVRTPAPIITPVRLWLEAADTVPAAANPSCARATVDRNNSHLGVLQWEFYYARYKRYQ